MLVMNAELRFPITDKVTGVIFTDWGTTWERRKHESGNWPTVTALFAPGYTLGLLRLDYGWGKNEENQRKGQFYFGIGQMF